MSGRISHLYLKPGHGAPMEAVSRASAVTGKGLEGDISFGRAKRQVLFIEQETLDDFGLQPGQVKENVTVAGIELAGLPAGTRLKAGEVLFEVTGDCAPCDFLEEIRPGLREAIRGRRGTLARVVTGGTVQVDDAIAALDARPGAP